MAKYSDNRNGIVTEGLVELRAWRKPRPTTLSILGGLIVLFAAALSAQSTGEIRGYAWDVEGRPMPTAKITLHAGNSESDLTLTATADGAFDARGLPPGHYELTASASDRLLTTESGTTLDLKPGEVAHADLTLGKSTAHYKWWQRLVHRINGPH